MSLGRLLGQLLGRRSGKPAVGGNLDPANIKAAGERAAAKKAGPGVSTKYVQDLPNSAAVRAKKRAAIAKERARLGIKPKRTGG